MMFSICLIQAIAFLDLLAIGLIVPLVPGHVRKMGASHIHVGLLGSIYSGFQLGSGPLMGSLSDLKGRKNILIMTLIVCAAAYTFMGFTTSIVLILFMRAILGVFKQTQMISRALVRDYEKNDQAQASIYGKMAAISGAGITLGPVIGGHIAEDNPETGFCHIAIVVGFIFLFNSVLVYFLPQIKKRSTKKKQSRSTSTTNLIYNSLKQSVLELYHVEWSRYWDVFLFKALVGFAMGVYYSNYSLYLKTQYGLSPKYIGYVISFQGVMGSISSFFIGYINSFYKSDHDYSQRNLHVFLLLSLSIVGLILSFNVYVYIALLIPLAVGNAIGRLVTLEMILKRCDKDHTGTMIGASSSVRSLSGVMAPMVAGFIGEFVGIPYVIYASLFATLLGSALSYHYRSKKLKVH